MATRQSRGLTATFVVCVGVLTWPYGLSQLSLQETLAALVGCVAVIASCRAIMIDVRHGENLLTSALWVFGCGVFTFGAFWSVFW